jgi:peptidoglycan/LPS O-acetylase OafA/YrhL
MESPIGKKVVGDILAGNPGDSDRARDPANIREPIWAIIARSPFGSFMRPSSTTGGPPRIHGLDTLRALAVTLVVLHHYVLFVSERSTFGWVGDVGWIGVDLFFALSGYLIGNQIFGGLASPAGFHVGRFYARRLLRTLPNFYVVLALYFCWPWFRDGMAMLEPWRFLTFTQNILLKAGTGFSHAWSLCIEEQFYLLLPALALLLAGRRGGTRLAWCLFGACVALGLGARAWFWLHNVDDQSQPLAHYYTYIYYASLCRLDALLAGVALALLKHFHGPLWERLLRHGGKAALLGAALVLAACGWFLHGRYGFWVTVLGYPMLALGLGLLVLAALAPDSALARLRLPGAERLALWSYAIYLVHRQISVLAARALAGAGYGPESMVAIMCVLLLSVLGGALLYYLVESPFMALRRRFVAATPPLSTSPSASLRSH